MSLIADQKEPCLAWRTGVNGAKRAYFIKRSGKKVRWLSLGEVALEDARSTVRKLRHAAALGELEARLGFSVRKAGVSNIGELFAAYRKFCSGIVIKERTMKNNILCLILIFQRVKGANFKVEAASINEFSASLLRDFAAETVRLRKKECDDLIAKEEMTEEEKQKKLEAVQRTIKSTVQQARSLFSSEAKSSKAYESLTLPDMGEVMSLSLGASSIVAYEPPPQKVIQRIARALPRLKKKNPGMWLAFNLEINAGLRRGSAKWCKWEWFTVIKKSPLTVDLHVAMAKGGKSILRFDSELYKEMLAMKGKQGGSVYVLPGETLFQRDAICENLALWLREKGLDKRQPNHELRKLYGDQKYIKHGAEEAQRALGHSDPKLTSKVYSSARARKSLRVI